MRFRTLVLTVVFLTVLVWSAYTIVHASSSYLEARGMVDHAYTEAANRRKTAAQTGNPESNREFAANVRARLLTTAERAGFGLEGDRVQVVEVPGGLQITVSWSFPALTYQGETYFSIPMSVTRTYSLS
jgi:hypothetical protein